MTKYVVDYDPMFDEVFQIEIDDGLAEKYLAIGHEVSANPVPNVEIKSRFRSDRHPGWND